MTTVLFCTSFPFHSPISDCLPELNDNLRKSQSDMVEKGVLYVLKSSSRANDASAWLGVRKSSRQVHSLCEVPLTEVISFYILYSVVWNLDMQRDPVDQKASVTSLVICYV